jgi:hypothetical protein
MKLPRVRFTVRRMMVAIAILAIFTYYVVMPTWDYYSLPPKTRAVLSKLGMPIRLPSPGPVPLGSVLKAIKGASVGAKDNGIPIYVDPNGLAEAGAGIRSTVEVNADRSSIEETLRKSLEPLRLGYFVKDGLLTITSAKSADLTLRSNPKEARRP